MTPGMIPTGSTSGRMPPDAATVAAEIRMLLRRLRMAREPHPANDVQAVPEVRREGQPRNQIHLTPEADMPAWTLQWNDLTSEQKDHLQRAAEYHACPCCGQAGQMALDMFIATVEVIQMRDRAEIEATMESSN